MTRAATDTITLAGGWGHGNLGDDLLLSAYVLEFQARGLSFDVVSARPKQTRRSLGPLADGVNIGSTWRLRKPRRLLLGGGGYLNGAWRRRGRLKGWGLLLLAWRADIAVAHAVEFRNYSSSFSGRVLAGLLLRQLHSISVRDPTSALEVASFNRVAGVVPDTVALLDCDKFDLDASAAQGGLLINLLPVERRPDRDEAQFSPSEWRPTWTALLESNPQARLLALGAQDAEYADTYVSDERVISVVDVGGFVQAVAGADVVIATRMHVALLAALTGKGVRALAYNGKVVPCLSAMGLAAAVLDIPFSQCGARFDVEGVRFEQSHLDRIRKQADVGLSAMLSALSGTSTEKC